MSDPTSTRPTRPSSTFQPGASSATAAPTDPGLPALGVLGLSAWFGLAIGLAELAMLLARHHLFGEATLGALQMNRHFLWMVPASGLSAALAVGIPLAIFARIWPRRAARPVYFALGMLAGLALLLTVRGLYGVACLVLAAGIASRLAPILARRDRAFRRAIVRRSLPVFVVGFAALVGHDYRQSVLAERSALAALPAARPGAPNVILITMDTVRAASLSLYGYERPTSPALDKLAARGVTFTEARSTAPWTLPSHASLFTGRWPHELSSGSDRPLDGTHPTLAEYLGRHGYATAGFIANTYYCNSWYGLDRGFVRYEDFYEDDLIVSPAEALRCSALGRRIVQYAGVALNSRPGASHQRKDAARINRDFLDWASTQQDRPFFAFLNYLDAHDPYFTPPGFDRHFGITPQTPADFDAIRTWHQMPRRDVTPHVVRLARDAYDDCIASLDEQIGKLFEDLQRRGMLANTVVVITSDHGEQFGEHDHYGHGKSLYRDELRVPLVIWGPNGVPAGERVTTPASLRDVAATVVDLAGLAEGSPFPGESLARAWRPTSHGSPAEAAPVISEVNLRSKASSNPQRAPSLRGPMTSLIGEGKVYIRNGDGREELYDLDADPAEARDLAHAAKPELTRLRSALDRLLGLTPRAR